MITRLKHLPRQPTRPPAFVERRPTASWNIAHEWDSQSELPKLPLRVARDLQLTYETSEELGRFHQPAPFEHDLFPQYRTVTNLVLQSGEAVQIPHRTWFDTTDGMAEESIYRHMATILQWAILVSAAPKQTYALVEIVRTQTGRLHGQVQEFTYRFSKTEKWATIFRSIGFLQFYKQNAHQLHPMIDMVLEFVTRTGLSVSHKMFDAHHPVSVNLPIEPVILQGGTELPQKSVPSGRDLPFGVLIQTFTQMLKNDLRATGTAKKLVTRHQHFAEREAGAKNWLSGILRRAHLVQAIRLEFDFAPEVIENGTDPVSNHLWTKFWNRVRHQSAAKHLIGRVWTKNWRLARGVTYRCLLILDASTEMTDVQAFHDTWKKVLPGVTLPGEVHAQDPFKWLTPVRSEAGEDRERLMKDVCLQGWLGWLIDIRGANPKETYGRSERSVPARSPKHSTARTRKGTCHDAALEYGYSAVMNSQTDQFGLAQS